MRLIYLTRYCRRAMRGLSPVSRLAYVWFCALFEIMLDTQSDRGVHPEIGNRVRRHEFHLGGLTASCHASAHHTGRKAYRKFLPDLTVIVSRDVIRV